MGFDGGKWPGIIGRFVTIKCWINVVYSKVWSAETSIHDVERVMTLIGQFLDGN